MQKGHIKMFIYQVFRLEYKYFGAKCNDFVKDG